MRTYRCNAVGQVVLALGTDELGLDELEAADGAQREGLVLLGAVGLAHDLLHLLLVLDVDLRAVLGPHQHRRVAERRVLQARPLALHHRRRQQRHDV